jgi:cytochrome P450
MKNRDALAKLVEEVDDFDARGQISRPHVTYAEAIKMPYLVACCKEGMRLHPSVGLGMPRHVPAGGVTIARRYFPEGSKVSINAAVLHYEDAVFGPQADRFKPERWLKGDALNMDKHMLHLYVS